jgi:hypothetical protein
MDRQEGAELASILPQTDVLAEGAGAGVELQPPPAATGDRTEAGELVSILPQTDVLTEGAGAGVELHAACPLTTTCGAPSSALFYRRQDGVQLCVRAFGGAGQRCRVHL